MLMVISLASMCPTRGSARLFRVAPSPGQRKCKGLVGYLAFKVSATGIAGRVTNKEHHTNKQQTPMKTITKLTIIAATVAAFASSAAIADNIRLWNQNAREAREAMRNQQTTVAVYPDRRGVNERGSREGIRFEPRWNTHGQFVGLYVPDTADYR